MSLKNCKTYLNHYPVKIKAMKINYLKIIIIILIDLINDKYNRELIKLLSWQTKQTEQRLEITTNSRCVHIISITRIR